MHLLIIRIIVFLVLLLPGIVLSQQTNSRNYIISRSYKQSGADANDVSKVVTQVRYFDGLGRPLQNVAVGQSPSGADLVEPIEFDGAGRQVRKYLPYVVAGGGAYQASAIPNVSAWYNANSAGLQASDLARPYIESFFEQSPLSRLMAQRQAGGKSANSSVKYKTNCCNELKRYDYELVTNVISQPGGYAPGTITYVQSTDEEGKVTTEYTDLTGAMVCRQVTASPGVVLSTYYIYDDIGLIRAVLQPQYQDNASLTDHAFTYDYDERGRMVVKRIPGGGITELVYDQFDRLVASRDANQTARSVWSFTKYNAANRPIVTGEIASAHSRAIWAANVAAIAEHHEERNNGVTAGYTLDKTAPINASEADLLTITFYDDYGFSKAASLSYNAAYYPSNNPAVKGLITGGRAKMLPGSGAAGSWLTSATYYDTEYRPIQTVHELYDLGAGSIERISAQYKYDLAQVVSEQKTEQLLAGNSSNIHLVTYSYDHADRLLSVKEKVTSSGNSQEAVTLSQRYNALGQLKSKWLHSSDGTNFRLRTDYTSNIRGWLTDGRTVYKKEVSGADLPYFGFNLAYINGLNYTNGNINEILWLNKDDAAFTEGLGFSDDGANRLTGSTVLMGYPDAESGISYDKNGNIKTLNRSGAVVDNLVYAYLGNRLSAVTDGSGSNLGVKSGVSNYSYDANGNMVSDGNRNATLSYNYLNLPKSVVIGGKTLTYDYDAAGTKHKYSADTLTLKYAGGFEYRQVGSANELYRIGLIEGQAVVRKGALEFEYSLKDHLGNVRVVFDKYGKVLQKTDYYSFGLEIDRNNPVQAAAVRNGINRYLFNSIERQTETGIYQARFRGLDPVIGRWMQTDPKPDQSMSLYAAMNNNPILFTDPLGDTIIVNKIGYISRNDKSDNLVFMQGDKGKLTALGELGKKINASEIYKNLLKKNIETAAGIYNPVKFRDLVKSKGEWDYKVNKNTIYGIGNDGKTQFLFKGKSMEAQDIGNHHFGAVANAYGFGQEFSLRQAGVAQMQSGSSRSEWQIYGAPEVTGWTPNGLNTTRPMLPPYGDDPRDQSFIKEGYRYYDQNKNN